GEEGKDAGCPCPSRRRCGVPRAGVRARVAGRSGGAGAQDPACPLARESGLGCRVARLNRRRRAEVRALYVAFVGLSAVRGAGVAAKPVFAAVPGVDDSIVLLTVEVERVAG